MSRSIWIASLALGGLLLMAGGGTAHATMVTCESKNGQFQTCPANTSGGVHLVTQLSSQGCWQNDTWGYDSNKIWVNNGCRAQFEVGPAKSSSSGNGGALAAAAVVGLAAAAVIANNDDHDHHHNNNNKNNRYDNDYDHYKNNRRYDYDYDDDRRYRNYDDPNWDYRNSRYGYNGYGGNPRNTFICESHGSKTTYCSMPHRGHVEIYRQMSSSRCTFSRTWGVEGKQVWVSDGCRAEFAVY